MKTFANAAMLCGVILFGIAPAVTDAQTASKTDQRIFGRWVDTDSGHCVEWNFKKDGTGTVDYYCASTGKFGFAVANGRIKFSDFKECDEDGCVDVKVDERGFSFSDNGTTLILEKTPKLEKAKHKKIGDNERGCCGQ